MYSLTELMTPLIFEAVLFLKVNWSYWSDITVKEAMAELRSERVQQRLAEDTEHTGVVHG